MKCAILECEKDAEFEIYDHKEQRPGMGATAACEAHVGVFLGAVPPTEPTGPWTVCAIDAGKELP